MTNKLIVFEDKRIRRTWHNNDWYYVIEDVVYAITESKNSKDYINKIKKRDIGLSEGWGQIVHTLEVETKGGKQRMNCANTKGIFRIIQSVPSKRAEPFKQWLSQLGQERIEEIENPELAQNRVKEYYELKGYPKDWIDKRLRGIAIRQELTEEWQRRGVEEKREFAILTNEISKATFGIGIKQHKDIKNIPKQSKANLRDHMNDLELIFTMLGEKATTEITQTHDSKKFHQLKQDSKKGGSIARNAILELEKETGRKVISKENYLNLSKKKKKKKLE
ncbi:MAG: phage antirepressor protein [Nanoarchaeota archaeon]|nr:phage antirepressor protein [Nanoarchaeota archaeon]MBU1977415.1 phage antirepressor protein [Nanoarchaeota archaeon]